MQADFEMGKVLGHTLPPSRLPITRHTYMGLDRVISLMAASIAMRFLEKVPECLHTKQQQGGSCTTDSSEERLLLTKRSITVVSEAFTMKTRSPTHSAPHG